MWVESTPTSLIWQLQILMVMCPMSKTCLFVEPNNVGVIEVV
jgi:hypothetical protein